MRIGIVGGGFVGRATARSFMEWADVKVSDTLRERATHSLSEVLGCDLIFVCLPTPQSAHSEHADLAAIESFFHAQNRSAACFVLKSTVPIGTTDRLRDKYQLPNLVHSPEFLTARCSLVDAQLPARNIIGGPDCECSRRLRELLTTRFPGVALFHIAAGESEAAKLICNAFFAVKVGYFNEIKTLSDKLGLNWERVMEAVMSDGRIAHSHTRVPGPDGRTGFGGACLPKDLANIVSLLEDHGLSAAITRGASERNLVDRA